MTRWPLLVLILAGLIATAWLGGSRAGRQRTAPVDSVRVVTIKEVVRVQDSSARHSLDSLRDAFRKRPIRDVVKYLPGDTVWMDSSEPAQPMSTIPEATLRETADSLASCRQGRDSTARQVTLWQARTASQDEARRLCEAKPAPAQPNPPSRLTWAGAGALGVLLTEVALYIYSITR